MRLDAHFGLGFPTAPAHALTLPRNATRRLILQKARRHSPPGFPDGLLRRFVGIRFQVLFHSPPGVLFTFPSRYWFTIGRQVVFSLRGWSPQIHSEFHVLAATWDPTREARHLSSTGLLPSVAALSMTVRLDTSFVTP